MAGGAVGRGGAVFSAAGFTVEEAAGIGCAVCFCEGAGVAGDGCAVSVEIGCVVTVGCDASLFVDCGCGVAVGCVVAAGCEVTAGCCCEVCFIAPVGPVLPGVRTAGAAGAAKTGEADKTNTAANRPSVLLHKKGNIKIGSVFILRI